MKKIILIPDSFKGTMSSATICSIMEKVIKKHFPNAYTVGIPVADGGEGSVDCFLTAVGGEKKYTEVMGVFGEPMQSYYGLLSDGETAVIEMASCAGLPLAEGKLNPATATTYGVGQLIITAAKEGAKQIIVGLGGSATNDGGCGAAAAAGVKFIRKSGEEFVPTGGTLKDIYRIDNSEMNDALRDVKITAMCDIDNPMFGENGAAYVFAPQKGADKAMVKELDSGLRYLNEILKNGLNKDMSTLAGGGAAGALGAGMNAFFGARLQMGIETVLDTVNFDKQLEDADLVLTGEGKIDSQSLRGKVIIGISRRCKKKSVPVVAIVGDIAKGAEAAFDEGVTAIFSINTVAMDFSESKQYSKENLAITMDNIMRFTKALT